MLVWVRVRVRVVAVVAVFVSNCCDVGGLIGVMVNMGWVDTTMVTIEYNAKNSSTSSEDMASTSLGYVPIYD